MNVQELANFIWSVAYLLRGDYKQSDNGEIILPFTTAHQASSDGGSLVTDHLAIF